MAVIIYACIFLKYIHRTHERLVNLLDFCDAERFCGGFPEKCLTRIDLLVSLPSFCFCKYCNNDCRSEI